MVEDVKVFAFDQQKNSGHQLKSRQNFATFLRCLSSNDDSDTIVSSLTNLRIMVALIQILNLSGIWCGNWTFKPMDEPQSSEASAHSLTTDLSRFPGSLPIADTIPNVHDCSYLNDRMANLPLKLPSRLLTLDEFDQALAGGIRRSGVFLYHTACHGCSACEPSRVDVRKFVWRDSFQRVLKRGDKGITIRVGRPIIDEHRLSIFNLHRTQRGLGDSDTKYQIDDYQGFLVDTCLAQTLELSFWINDALVGISIVDCGRTSLSAVYTFFDPLHSKLSLGTYSILKQIEYARDSGRQYMYLGMVVLENQHLNYKTRFTPHERWIQGHWVEFN